MDSSLKIQKSSRNCRNVGLDEYNKDKLYPNLEDLYVKVKLLSRQFSTAILKSVEIQNIHEFGKK